MICKAETKKIIQVLTILRWPLNFVGKFDAKLPADGSAAHSHVHVEQPSTHAPSDAIIVPDAHLLFGADFKRSGVDLILSNADRELVVHDYFKGCLLYTSPSPRDR